MNVFESVFQMKRDKNPGFLHDLERKGNYLLLLRQKSFLLLSLRRIINLCCGATCKSSRYSADG